MLACLRHIRHNCQYQNIIPSVRTAFFKNFNTSCRNSSLTTVSSNKRTTNGQQTSDKWSTMGLQLVDSWPTVGRQMVWGANGYYYHHQYFNNTYIFSSPDFNGPVLWRCVNKPFTSPLDACHRLSVAGKGFLYAVCDCIPYLDCRILQIFTQIH